MKRWHLSCHCKFKNVFALLVQTRGMLQARLFLRLYLGLLRGGKKLKTDYDFVGSYSVEKCAAHLAILVYYRCCVQNLISKVSPQLKPGIIIDSAPLFYMHEFINKILRQGITEYWYCTCQLQTVHTLYKNRAKSTGGNRARFS